MKCIYLLFFFCSCCSRGVSLGGDFEILNLDEESPHSINYVLSNGEVKLISGPIDKIGINNYYITAQNTVGYYYFDRIAVMLSKPPNRAVIGPLNIEDYMIHKLKLNLPDLKALQN